MNYKLMESFDLGCNYTVVDQSNRVHALEAVADKLDKGNRWVIVDDKDMPVKWCEWVENFIKSARENPGVKLMTEDPYATKLLLSMGRDVMTAGDLITQMGLTT